MMLPPALPRHARSTYQYLERTFGAYIANVARDQRSPATRRRGDQLSREHDVAVLHANKLFVGIEPDIDRYPGFPDYVRNMRDIDKAVEEAFPGYKDSGYERANAIAAERKRKNGAKVRATLARKRARGRF